MLMFLDEVFLQRDVEIRDIGFGQRRGTLMDARLAQKRTIQGTIDGLFAAGSAALRTNIGVDAGAMPAGTPLFAELTEDTQLLSYHSHIV